MILHLDGEGRRVGGKIVSFPILKSDKYSKLRTLKGIPSESCKSEKNWK